ncbi:hypothetical protein [Tautonia marina]|uniref:hypothetical protein n=1 Tax=Tautonia marina TaxID=2653855 RepID=UPI0012610475|nr:hypothetical protein [Tautonia marina]
MVSIALETLVAASSMFGEAQESRAAVRESQDHSLVDRIHMTASQFMPVSALSRRHFFVAPLDLLVHRDQQGRPRFQVAELNGTGIGGLTNMTEPAVASVLDAFSEIPEALPVADEGSPPLIVIASSGRENRKSPRVNRLFYEKILYADAIARGFACLGERCDLLSWDQIARMGTWQPTRPTVVLGHLRELAEAMTCDSSGRLRLCGSPVSATVNDRFCMNLVKRFDNRIDLDRWFTANRCFVAGADKATAYDVFNHYNATLDPGAFPLVDRAIPFARARTRVELIETVLAWVRAGRRTVIKPMATGLGHGIEFFLDSDEPTAAIISRIDRSLSFIQEHYDYQGGGLPYTVCEYLDSAVIDDPTHHLHGHKFELRVVVYRDGDHLRPFPSIAKVSAARFDAASVDRGMLINNVTASSSTTSRPGREYVLPLSNEKTLATLGIEESELADLCRFCTGYVASVLETLEPASVPAPLGLRVPVGERSLVQVA